MYCTRCGKEINDKAVICVHCGVFVNGCPQTVKPPEIQPPMPQATPPEVQPEANTTPPRKKVNGFSIAGFVTAVASIVLGLIFVGINVAQYTGGVYLQYYCAIPLLVALVFSIIGTVKGKKTKSGLGLGIAGIVISGGVVVLTILYFTFTFILACLAIFLFFVFLILI